MAEGPGDGPAVTGDPVLVEPAEDRHFIRQVRFLGTLTGAGMLLSGAGLFATSSTAWPVNGPALTLIGMWLLLNVPRRARQMHRDLDRAVVDVYLRDRDAVPGPDRKGTDL